MTSLVIYAFCCALNFCGLIEPTKNHENQYSTNKNEIMVLASSRYIKAMSLVRRVSIFNK